MNKNAVVLLSGGVDSATVLAMARSQGYNCYCISFAYGQRHSSELVAAKQVATVLGAVEHVVINLDVGQFGGSALTDPTIQVPDYTGSKNIPVTYVPARNITFLSIALGYAETRAADHIFIGASTVDYSGYPDCRPEFMAAFEKVANLATKVGVETGCIRIEAPLINLSKAATIQAGLALGVDYSLTVSCYQADTTGLACGRCDSCMLRKKGFTELGVADPTRYIHGT